MDVTMLAGPAALIAFALWFTFRNDGDRRAVAATLPVERVKWSLRERLVRGELSVDEFRRLTALMQLPE